MEAALDSNSCTTTSTFGRSAQTHRPANLEGCLC